MVGTVSAPVSATEQYFSSTVKQIYPLASGDFVLLFDTESPNCTSASSPKYYYVQVGQNNMTIEGSKKIYSAAMLAYSMNKQLSVAFDDATYQCFINRVTIF